MSDSLFEKPVLRPAQRAAEDLKRADEERIRKAVAFIQEVGARMAAKWERTPYRDQ